jgi:hypothetical protein
MQQLVAAVEPQYITAMRNQTTGQFTGIIYQLLQYLLTVHGKITPSQLLHLEQETKPFAYDPSTPVGMVFNQVKDLVEYGEMANCTFTMSQTINIAYATLNLTTKLKESIKTWNRLPALQKTCIAFKIHFHTARNKLQETGELTMEDAGYHQANLIEAIASRVAKLQPATPSPSPPPAAPINDSILPTIVPQMEQMQQMMAAMQTTTDNRQPATTPQEQRPQPTEPRTGEPNRPLPPWATKYCWTHGKCAHASARCNNQAPGHQSNATMENKQTGSTYGCT